MNAAPDTGADTRSPGQPAGEPSMEEILASIRRIIADEQALAPGHAAVAPAVAAPVVQPVRPELRAGPGPEPQLVRSESEFDHWLAQTADAQAYAAAREAPAVPAYAQNPTPLQYAQATVIPMQTGRAEQRSAAGEPFYAAAASETRAVQAIVQDQQPLNTPAPAYAPPPQTYEAPQYHAAPASQHLELSAQAPRLTIVPQVLPEQARAVHGEAADDLEMPLRPGLEPESLLSTMAETSVQSSFQALARTMVLQNSGLVEGAVQQMLQPMLKQWLDDNLPVIVERLVRAEIERVARGGR